MGFVVLCTGWGETFSIRVGVPNVSSPREQIFFFVSFAVFVFFFFGFFLQSFLFLFMVAVDYKTVYMKRRWLCWENDGD